MVLVSRRREVYYYQCGGCLSERGGARPRAQRSFHVAQALELVPRRVRLRKPACGTACVKPHGHGAHFLARAAALCQGTRGKWNGNSTIRFAAWWGRGSAYVARAAVAQTHTCQAARGAPGEVTHAPRKQLRGSTRSSYTTECEQRRRAHIAVLRAPGVLSRPWHGPPGLRARAHRQGRLATPGGRPGARSPGVHEHRHVSQEMIQIQNSNGPEAEFDFRIIFWQPLLHHPPPCS